MNKQEIFNIVYVHLLKQGEKSIGHVSTWETCLYRGLNGNKCAAGVLIPDEVYQPDMESNMIATVVDQFQGLDHIRSEVDFVLDLQLIHDKHYPAFWRERLETLAKEHSLVIPVYVA